MYANTVVALLDVPGCFSDATPLVHREELQTGRTGCTIRCGDCEARRDVTMPRPLAARLEQVLADQLAAMELGAERFVAAPSAH